MKAAFKYEVLEEDCIYHVYNRANGNEKIFRQPADYTFFLQQYSLYILPIADTFCYCLMPNHFHLLIRIKPRKELIYFFEGLQRLRNGSRAAALRNDFPKSVTLENHDTQQPLNLEKLLSKLFSNLFSSYTQSGNKKTGRMGSLFMKNFKRKRVDSTRYLHSLTQYIHLNPVEASLCRTPDQWPYSSYKLICTQENSILCASEVISWYGDLENFKFMHRRSSAFEPF